MAVCATLILKQTMESYEIWISIGLFICLASCATRNAAIHTFDESFQTPEIDLSLYKDPELRSSNQQKDVAVVLAISGGGYRSGNFASGVFEELENIDCGIENHNVLKEVDFISTVSGGGIPAALLTSTLTDYKNKVGSIEGYSFSNELKNNNLMRELERSRHNVLLAGLVSLASIGPLDRGDFLQREFDKYLLGSERRGRSLTLGDIFIPKNKHKIPHSPMWIANATVFENGSIFPFYPDTIDEYEIEQYTHCLWNENLESPYDLPLSIGLKASSSFPFVIPATTLRSAHDKNNMFIHLFDGGQSDNLGVLTALQMIDNIDKKRKILIIIDSYVGETEPFSGFEGSPTAVRAAIRATTISLDAWRIRYKWFVEQYKKKATLDGTKFDVINISFDSLDSDKKKAIKAIGTNFNISKNEQILLFDAASDVVSMKSKEIEEIIFDKECS